MLALYRKNITLYRIYQAAIRFRSGGYQAGRGAGAGGGGGGSIRSAGGSFAVLEAVREEEYFIKQQSELVRKLRTRKISLDVYHTNRLKILREYEDRLRNRK